LFYILLGIFPEQNINWSWIINVINTRLNRLNQSNSTVNVDSNSTGINNNSVRILNGFAYTGGSTLACISVGDNSDSEIQVVHLDSAKSSVNWAKNNFKLSNFNNVQNDVEINSKIQTRWIVDDCISFIEREIKRGNTYDGLIFDPPAFGKGIN
jgi:23S rRNA (cytosine1962-C5)-methyltransferase